MLNFRSNLKCIPGAAAAIVVMSLASAAGAITLGAGVGSLGSAEPNWTLTSSPGSTSLTIVSSAQDYPGAWVVAPAGSNWITPYARGGTTATGEAPGGRVRLFVDLRQPRGLSRDTMVVGQWCAVLPQRRSHLVEWHRGPAGYGSLVPFVILAALFGASNTFL